MSQGWYRGRSDNPQRTRAIDPIFFISYAPNSTPTIGVKGQFAIEISTGSLWQKQDDGKTTNWILFTGSGDHIVKIGIAKSATEMEVCLQYLGQVA